MSSSPCPSGGQFYACASFVGCCTSQTCLNEVDTCSDENLRPANFVARYSNQGSCYAGSSWMVCANIAFMGCCKGNVSTCLDGCPQEDLTPARLSSNQDTAAAAPLNTYLIDPLSLPSTTASISQTLSPLGIQSSSSFSQSPVQSLSTPPTSSSSSSRPTLPSQSTATAVTLPSSTHTPSSSGSTGETSKLIIGLAVAIAVSILLATIGLAYFCIIRKRRRRKDQAANPHQDANESKSEEENSHLYFQQKVELDAEQRRHEMRAKEIRYELEGDFEIREMPAEERERHFGRQELPGEEPLIELDNG